MKTLVLENRSRILRAIFSFIVGALILLLNNESYDTRFSIRPHTAFSEDAISVTFKNTSLFNKYINKLKNIPLSGKKIYVNTQNTKLLQDTNTNNSALSYISLNEEFQSNSKSAYSVHLSPDSDGVLRRVQIHSGSQHKNNKHRIINYTTDPKSITSLIVKSKKDIDSLLNSKSNFIIINIANEVLKSDFFQTPFGRISKTELDIILSDNIFHNKWISKVNYKLYLVYLLIIIILSSWIILSYPNSVSFVLALWLITFIIALSLWLFDSFHIWIPILSPVISIGLIYFTFLSYELTRKEHHNLDLKNKQKLSIELEELKDNFISLISHDLKTPIAKIQGIVNKSIINCKAPELLEDLKSVLKESEDLDRYIKTILRLSKIESKNIKLDLQTTDINQTIGAALKKVQFMADKKEIDLGSELDPIFLTQFDPALIYEVILNLLENSIKYNNHGGKTTIFSSETNNEIIVIVEDNGPGISKENLNLIFDKFKRVDKTNVTSKGTGLGLYLVKYFVELHKGEVFIESSHKKGTSIGFTLPIQ